jgi:hypothetical protein
MATGTSITTDDLDRVGVSRHAEAFGTLAQCRARFEQIKAHLNGSDSSGVCVFTLRPDEGEGLPHWTAAVLATGERPPRLVPRGRPIDLPDAVWAQFPALPPRRRMCCCCGSGAARSVKGDDVRMRIFCSVCTSSQQTLIDHRLRGGESLRTLSADYGLPVRELRHHRDQHVTGRSMQRRPRRPAPLMP